MAKRIVWNNGTRGNRHVRIDKHKYIIFDSTYEIKQARALPFSKKNLERAELSIKINKINSQLLRHLKIYMGNDSIDTINNCTRIELYLDRWLLRFNGMFDIYYDLLYTLNLKLILDLKNNLYHHYVDDKLVCTVNIYHYPIDDDITTLLTTTSKGVTLSIENSELIYDDHLKKEKNIKLTTETDHKITWSFRTFIKDLYDRESQCVIVTPQCKIKRYRGMNNINRVIFARGCVPLTRGIHEFAIRIVRDHSFTLVFGYLNRHGVYFVGSSEFNYVLSIFIYYGYVLNRHDIDGKLLIVRYDSLERYVTMSVDETFVSKTHVRNYRDDKKLYPIIVCSELSENIVIIYTKSIPSTLQSLCKHAILNNDRLVSIARKILPTRLRDIIFVN